METKKSESYIKTVYASEIAQYSTDTKQTIGDVIEQMQRQLGQKVETEYYYLESKVVEFFSV